MWSIKNLFKTHKKRSKDKSANLKQALKAKYQTFQYLLDQNNSAHLLMADVKEKLSGEYLFDRHYMNTSVKSMSEAVLSVINSLDELSNGGYKGLYSRYNIINEEIRKILFPNKDIPVSAFTIPIEGLSCEISEVAGGKIAHLADIKNRLAMPVPDGFSITAYAFKRFMEHNNLTEKINRGLSELNIGNIEEINRFCRGMRELVIQAEIPSELQYAIQKAVADLKSKIKESCSSIFTSSSKLMVAVRSSAIQEDGEASFAGQYATFLNVPEDLITLKYKEVIASLFRPRAVFYYKTKGFSETEMVMPVGVINMIDAKAGGVVYSRDPNDPGSDRIIINAARGLGKSVVDGLVIPNTFIVSREKEDIVEKDLSEQCTMFVCTQEGDIIEAAVPDSLLDAPCMNDDQIKALSGYASVLEKHYEKPQDIEWAIDCNDQIYILQSRPLKTFSAHISDYKIPRRLEKYNILIDKGLIVCKGIGYGPAFIINNEADLKDFKQGCVLVAKNMTTDFVVAMDKAAAIMTDTGSITGHMASLAREYEIPTIVADTATTSIKHGQEITVDAFNCNVYEGRVSELIDYTSSKKETFQDTHLFKTFNKVLKWILPLNLVDPGHENFRPGYCKTFHDITRFAHEKAMSEMFMIGKGHEIKGSTIALKKNGPLDAHLIDMDGGVKEGTEIAALEDILSIPFSAFLNGLLSMEWPEPRPADVTGFLGMVANLATQSETEIIKTTGQRSFALIARNYMNFSIRLGYHFSMIEAYCGENRNDNYIKFFFKGGGAAVDRRLRRVRLITEILKQLDFRVKITEDLINANLFKYEKTDIVKKLEVLGKLTVYTKQLDLIMYNDTLTDQRIEEFIKEHVIIT